MNTRVSHFAWCLATLLSTGAIGSVVTVVGEDEPMVTISNERLNNPTVDEKLCFYRRNTETKKIEKVSCGLIAEVGPKQVMVKIADGTAKPLVGDFAQVVKDKKAVEAKSEEPKEEKKREPAAAPEKTEKVEPVVEKAAPVVEAATAPAPSTTAAKSSTKAEPLRPLAFALMVGAHVGTTHYSYIGDFQLVNYGHVSVGVQPVYGAKKSDTAIQTSWMGANLTVNYYSEPNLRGFWLQVGSGIYMITVAGEPVVSMSPAGLFTLGWRERWAGNLNIGLAAGYQYIANPQRPTITSGVTFAQPVFMGTIGFIF